MKLFCADWTRGLDRVYFNFLLTAIQTLFEARARLGNALMGQQLHQDGRFARGQGHPRIAYVDRLRSGIDRQILIADRYGRR